MSLIHYLFAGHFERENGHVKFVRDDDTGYRPVVRAAVDPGAIPEEWLAWVADGYLVCDMYTKNVDEVEFVVRLVEATGCDLYDVAARADITVAEWLALTPLAARD